MDIDKFIVADVIWLTSWINSCNIVYTQLSYSGYASLGIVSEKSY